MHWHNNSKKSFLKSANIETGISDCHKLTISILRKHTKKSVPKIKYYRRFRILIKALLKKSSVTLNNERFIVANKKY